LRRARSCTCTLYMLCVLYILCMLFVLYIIYVGCIIRQHTSAYVSIRQHTSAYVSIRTSRPSCMPARRPVTRMMSCPFSGGRSDVMRSRSSTALTCCDSIRQHKSAYGSIRQHTHLRQHIARQHSTAHIIHQHTSAYVSIRQHMSAYVSTRQHTHLRPHIGSSAFVSIHQHTSAYVSIRQHTYQPTQLHASTQACDAHDVVPV
jgi:hypothetical protein